MANGKLQNASYLKNTPRKLQNPAKEENSKVLASIFNKRNGLPWATEMRYLGVFLVSSNIFKCSLDYAKRSFYLSTNSLIGRVANSSTVEIMLHLVNSKCFPYYCMVMRPVHSIRVIRIH